jgi:hypothetical protein
LHRETLETALLRVRVGIQNFAAQHGAAHQENSLDEFLKENAVRTGAISHKQ